VSAVGDAVGGALPVVLAVGAIGLVFAGVAIVLRRSGGTAQ
jgi:hypothetical protein